jgi:hypothetical protein
MYPAIYNKDGSLKHSNDCKMAFGKKDAECPRCAEMLAGAPARSGWQKDFYDIKKRADAMEKAAIKAHVCS